MEADEEGTRARLRSLHAELIAPRIAADGGRIVKTMGDGILVEFPSAVDAVRNALAVQDEMRQFNEGVPEDSKIEFRVGINVGDVIVEGDDIYGDGVNVAARLEGLCAPGEVYVSGNVYDHAAGKLAVSFEDLGEQTVKNIAKPVRIYRMRQQSEETAVTADLAEPLPLPDKPSIAVLPFDTMTDDRDIEYLADGLVEDIITLLARMPGFFVIARNSSFSYKGQQRDIRDVGRELGVRYVIEGSVRPMGKRLRITVQLVDAVTGNHLWAERFDRAADDIYEIQDEVTTGIVTRLEPELTRAEFEQVKRRPVADRDAWAHFQQANGLLSLKGWHEETFAEAADLYRKANKLDPDFAASHARLSLLQALGHMVGYVSEPDEALAEAERALELDSRGSDVLGFAGCAISDLGYVTRGIELLERAIESDPSNAQAWAALGAALVVSKRVEEGIEKLAHGIRISPRDNRRAVWRGLLAMALGRQGNLEEAIEQARLACGEDSKFHNSRVILTMLLIRAERLDEAKEAFDEALRIRPTLSEREIQGILGRRSAEIVQSFRQG
jgi:adenylate cyclase